MYPGKGLSRTMKICNHYEKERGPCCLPEKKGVAKVRALQAEGTARVKGWSWECQNVFEKQCDFCVRHVRDSHSKGMEGRKAGKRHLGQASKGLECL